LGNYVLHVSNVYFSNCIGNICALLLNFPEKLSSLTQFDILRNSEKFRLSTAINKDEFKVHNFL